MILSQLRRGLPFLQSFNDSWLGPLSAIAHTKQFSLTLGRVELSMAFTNYCIYLFGGEGSTRRDQVYLAMWVLGM